jgi:hypothetical protein
MRAPRDVTARRFAQLGAFSSMGGAADAVLIQPRRPSPQILEPRRCNLFDLLVY